MIVVDSSVWIDFLTGIPTRQADYLDSILTIDLVIVPDLVLVEVLQGCRTVKQFEETRSYLNKFQSVECVGRDRAIQASRNYRLLRERGVTIRKTIDTLLATYCIDEGHNLLYADRDFDPFVEHLGLVPALPGQPS